ncbi:hypothetical protein PENTCL1PPCAC_14251, partial [Pristionchus entomophagus]
IRFVVGLVLITATWQLTPAPSIFQYLTLSKRLGNGHHSMSLNNIILTSYTPSIVMMVASAIWAFDFIPTPQFEQKIIEMTRRFYNFSDDEIVPFAYGLTFQPDSSNNTRSLYSLRCLSVVLTYFITYGLFFFVLFRVHVLLQKNVLSKMTQKLQRRFMQLQLIQVSF